jgi:hypothetical protein
MLQANATAQSVIHLTAGSHAIALPAGYTDASVLFMRLKTTAKIKVTVISPTNGTRTMIVAGSTATPGYCQLQERITSISVKYLAATADITFFTFQVPDLTVSTNFKGVSG